MQVLRLPDVVVVCLSKAPISGNSKMGTFPAVKHILGESALQCNKNYKERGKL